MKKPFLIFMFMLLAVATTSAQSSVPIECGNIIESRLTEDGQADYFSLNLEAGTQVTANAIPLGSTLDLVVAVQAPNEDVIAHNEERSGSWVYPEDNPIATTDILSDDGIYTIIVTNTWFGVGSAFISDNPNHSRGTGYYTLYVSCILRDGTVIEAGGGVVPDVPDNPIPVIPAYGFPGLLPVDFSTAVELPLMIGQAQTAPIAGDLVTVYPFEAGAGTTATLNITRASGDVSVGVAVIHKDTNAIIFMGGLPFTDSLSAVLNFPFDGTYAIGLFQLPTAERPDTSGAVEITLQQE